MTVFRLGGIPVKGRHRDVEFRYVQVVPFVRIDVIPFYRNVVSVRELLGEIICDVAVGRLPKLLLKRPGSTTYCGDEKREKQERE